MKKTIGAVVISIASLSGGVACAESYWGVGVSSFELDSSFDGVGLSADIKGIEGLIGFAYSPHIAWELRVGLGLGDDNVTLSAGGQSISTSIKYQVESYFSGYFRPQFVRGNFQAYGLLGYSSVSGELSGGGDSEDTSDDGISYGVGAGVLFGERNAINIEWKNLAKIDGGDITGVTLSYQRKF